MEYGRSLVPRNAWARLFPLRSGEPHLLILPHLLVLVSWTINPYCARKDSVTNDLIAVLTIPVVAAAHFFYQVRRRPDIKWVLASLDESDVLLLASLEAPLTVCEDFIVWAAPVFFSFAASRGH
jgi:hypothetical protein